MDYLSKKERQAFVKIVMDMLRAETPIFKEKREFPTLKGEFFWALTKKRGFGHARHIWRTAGRGFANELQMNIRAHREVVCEVLANLEEKFLGKKNIEEREDKEFFEKMDQLKELISRSLLKRIKTRDVSIRDVEEIMVKRLKEKIWGMIKVGASTSFPAGSEYDREQSESHGVWDLCKSHPHTEAASYGFRSKVINILKRILGRNHTK